MHSAEVMFRACCCVLHGNCSNNNNRCSAICIIHILLKLCWYYPKNRRIEMFRNINIKHHKYTHHTTNTSLPPTPYKHINTHTPHYSAHIVNQHYFEILFEKILLICYRRFGLREAVIIRFLLISNSLLWFFISIFLMLWLQLWFFVCLLFIMNLVLISTINF